MVQVANGLLKLSKITVFLGVIFLVLRLFYAPKHINIPMPDYHIEKDFYSYFYSFFSDTLDLLIPLVVFIAIPLLVISLLKYIIFKFLKKEDQQKLSEIKKTITYTVITLCLTLAFWFVAGFVSSLFGTIDKPVIYLYPEQKQEIIVRLDYQGKIIAEYPEYNEDMKGWKVTAYPDGKIINHADEQEYSYLFWEGKPNEPIDWNLSKGFVVKGENTREFLQETLSQIGLTPKEYNEFIVYWYPLMKDNPYNIIHFADEQYTKTAPLTIKPKPDSMLRVFMVFKPINKKIEIEPQVFQPFERKGFTVVEWGGTEVK